LKDGLEEAQLDEAELDGDVDALEVYWRPGCPSCNILLSTLERAGTTIRLHNIWEDDDARAFVRGQNSGNETVPTVRLGSLVATNPPPAVLLALIEQGFPALLGDAVT
jgi:mycoredoxin